MHDSNGIWDITVWRPRLILFLSTWHHKREFQDERTYTVIHKKYCTYFLISNIHAIRGWQLGGMRDCFLELWVWIPLILNTEVSSHVKKKFHDEIICLLFADSLMLLCTPTECEKQLQTTQLTVLCTGVYNSSKKNLGIRNFIPVWSIKYL